MNNKVNFSKLHNLHLGDIYATLDKTHIVPSYFGIHENIEPITALSIVLDWKIVTVKSL